MFFILVIKTEVTGDVGHFSLHITGQTIIHISLTITLSTQCYTRYIILLATYRSFICNQVANSAIMECSCFTDMSGKDFMKNTDDVSIKLLEEPSKP